MVGSSADHYSNNQIQCFYSNNTFMQTCMMDSRCDIMLKKKMLFFNKEECIIINNSDVFFSVKMCLFNIYGRSLF